jgi:hypothetical protein
MQNCPFLGLDSAVFLPDSQSTLTKVIPFKLRNLTLVEDIPLCLQHNSFIHLSVCLTTGPKPLSKRARQTAPSRASSFRCEYPFISLRSSSSFLRLLPRLHVRSIPPFMFPSITCRRRQILRKM